MSFEFGIFLTLALAIFSITTQLVIVNNKLDALIKAVREQQAVREQRKDVQ